MEAVSSEETRNQCPHEICVKGLPLNAKEFDLASVFGVIAPVLRIRFRYPNLDPITDLTKYNPPFDTKTAFIQFANKKIAEETLKIVTEVEGRPVEAFLVEPHPFRCLPPVHKFHDLPISWLKHPKDPFQLILPKLMNHRDPKGLFASSINYYMDVCAGKYTVKEVRFDFHLILAIGI